MKKSLIIVGASGHGKVAADIATRNSYEEILFLDDDTEIKDCLGFPIVGQVGDIGSFSGDFFVAIGNPTIREEIQNRLERLGKTIVSLIHPSAVVGHAVTIECGTIVMAGAVINPCTVIERGCIINTCASVDHDCRIGSFAHISVGAHVAGTVRVGTRTWIGIGAVIKNNLSIAPDCMIGSGAVVVKDIQETGTYLGVPARKATGSNAID